MRRITKYADMARIDRFVGLPEGLNHLRRPHPDKPHIMELIPVAINQRIICLLQEANDAGPIDGPTLIGLHGHNSDTPQQYYQTGNPRRLVARWACPVTVIAQSGDIDTRGLSLRPIIALRAFDDWLRTSRSEGRPSGLEPSELPPSRWFKGTLDEAFTCIGPKLHGMEITEVGLPSNNPDHFNCRAKGRRVYATIETGEGAGPFLKIGKAQGCGPLRRLQLQQTCNWRTLRQVRCWRLPVHTVEKDAEKAMRHSLQKLPGVSRAIGGSEWFRGNVDQMLICLDDLAKGQQWASDLV